MTPKMPYLVGLWNFIDSSVGRKQQNHYDVSDSDLSWLSIVCVYTNFGDYLQSTFDFFSVFAASTLLTALEIAILYPIVVLCHPSRVTTLDLHYHTRTLFYSSLREIQGDLSPLPSLREMPSVSRGRALVSLLLTMVPLGRKQFFALSCCASPFLHIHLMPFLEAYIL